MEQEIYKPKLRVTTLSENGTPLSDRLVDAYTEMNSGPKVQHKGPVRVEVTLTNKQDIDNFKEYLDRLTGVLPAKAPTAGRGRPAGTTIKNLESPREDILADVEKMVEEGKSQQEIIKYLRELGFVFILTEDFLYHFPGFEFDKRMLEKQPIISNIQIHSPGWQDVSNGPKTPKQINSIQWLSSGLASLVDHRRKLFRIFIKKGRNH